MKAIPKPINLWKQHAKWNVASSYIDEKTKRLSIAKQYEYDVANMIVTVPTKIYQTKCNMHDHHIFFFVLVHQYHHLIDLFIKPFETRTTYLNRYQSSI